MPILHAYNNKPGYYLRTVVDGNPITFQITPQAGELLQEMGYRPESDISWNVLKPLHDQGEIYTHQTGAAELEVSTSINDSGELTSEQKRILKEYLEDEEAHSIPVSIYDDKVHSAVADLTAGDVNATTVLNSLPDHDGFAHSLLHAKDIPFRVEGIEAENDNLVYSYETSDNIRIQCTDTRWNPAKDIDFHVVIQPEDALDMEFSVIDGYIASWHCDGDSRLDHRLDIPDRHKEAYKTDKPRMGGLGFDPENRTELLQRLFLFIDHYDLRPDPRGGGHRKVATQSELENQHIWVTPRKTVSSSHKVRGRTCNSFMIQDELVDITIQDVEPYVDVLISIQDIQDGRATTQRVDIERGDKSTVK